MPSLRVRRDLNDGVYFLTFTVRHWYYVLDRHNRWQILLDCLRFYQANNDLSVYAWVFMLNHLHLIVHSNDVSGFIRSYKSFTTKAMKDNILATEPNILHLFTSPGQTAGFRFWEETNMPLKVETMPFLCQKYTYIHENPVRKQYVRRPEDWVFSSANPERLLDLAEVEGVEPVTPFHNQRVQDRSPEPA